MLSGIWPLLVISKIHDFILLNLSEFYLANFTWMDCRGLVNRDGAGLGATEVGAFRNTYGLTAGDDEYSAYRKRMMLAYKFRPNPLVCLIFL